MISFDEAQSILRAQPRVTATEALPIGQSIGRVCAKAVTSPINLPSFRNSAMDGYALRHADLQGFNELTCIGTQTAGDAVLIRDDVVGGCLRIMTGAQVPDMFDTVVPVEQTEAEGERIRFLTPVHSGANIREAGEDVATGATVLRAGDVMTPERLMLCAALGIEAVEVIARPPLYVFSTGDEVGGKSETAIHDSNSPYLLSAAAREHLNVTFGGHVADDPEAYVRAIEAVPAGSVIVTTGGVSAGTKDFIPATLKEMGADILFHKVRQKPGKPILFARLPNGSYVFGLPGNPASAAVGFRLFVLALYRALDGRPPETALPARLTQPLTRKSGLTQFLKAHATLSKDGLRVTPLDGQESFRIHSLAAANAFIRLPEDGDAFAAGDWVDILPLSGSFPFAGEP